MEEPYSRYDSSADEDQSDSRRDCSNSKRSKRKPITCFKCREKHISSQCPRSREFLVLSAEGKWVRDMKESTGRNRNRRACFHCGSNDHSKRDCAKKPKVEPTDQKDNHRACFRCGSNYHLARECPKRTKVEPIGSISRSSFPDYLTSELTALTSHHLSLTPHPGAYGLDDITGIGMRTEPGFGGLSEARLSFPGYLTSEPTALTSHHLSLTRHPGAYGLDDSTGIGMGTEPGFDGLTEASIRGYPHPRQDPILLGQRPDVAVAIGSGIPDLINGRPVSLAKVDAPSVPTRESNILFVDGLPSDSSRREVSHLFRPFIGFKDIRVVHKESRHSGDKSLVLCFVEFDDAKCALTALEALQGYKFDNKKPDSPVLRIHFAHFPFRLPSDCGVP